MTIEPSDAEVEAACVEYFRIWPELEGSSNRTAMRAALIAAARERAAVPGAVAWRYRVKVGFDLEWRDWTTVDVDPNDWTWPKHWTDFECQPLYTHPVLPDREGDAEARLSVIRKSLLMALYGDLTPRPEPTIELVKAIAAVALRAQEALADARTALMSRRTREGFERELHEGIVNRLGILTVGTCSCDTKSPELKYHSEGCRYRIASEALELARPFYAATGEREPSRATVPAGEDGVRATEEQAAYGLLWRMHTTDTTIHAARRSLMAAIGKDGQRAGINWARAAFGPHKEPNPEDMP